ncbi:MAG: transcriptional regulator [Pseudobdellovibrio sp.]|nr:transcriptional regulator [Pseudobdellovibrio sp.]
MKKQPKQKRSQVMVEAILEASTRVLSKTSIKEMTTNKVADLAGVSIGSLYEYFPNKNEIVVALMDNRMEKILGEFNQTLQSHHDIEGLIVTVLDFLEEEYLLKKNLLRQIFTLAPEAGRMEALYLGRIKAQKALEKFLTEKMKKDADWAEKKSFLAVNAVLGIVEMYIFVDEMKLTHEEFKKEVTKLMRNILELP